MAQHGEAGQDETVRDEEAGTAVEKRLRGWWRAGRAAARRDEGMTTSEYAVGTIAAAAFAAVLYKIVTSGAVSGALESVIGKALDAPF
ncbi:DUF4244 domain-containing protein [Streptomyces sp. NPDC015661]|uniref:DUF4244 domain-containing protein n=1 Tax=Streptomyces sp. NPDC015661 TaxID=3364961 RepID=UPI0036F91C3A